jgi:hypothetical protein
MTMQIEDEYHAMRLATCENPPCSFDEEIEMHLVCYGFDEIAEWECPACESMNEYRSSLIGDYEDRAYDRRKEDW